MASDDLEGRVPGPLDDDEEDDGRRRRGARGRSSPALLDRPSASTRTTPRRDLPEEPPRRQLDGEPRREEARDQQEPALARGERVDGVERRRRRRRRAGPCPRLQSARRTRTCSSLGAWRSTSRTSSSAPSTCCPSGRRSCAATPVAPTPSSTPGRTGSPTPWPTSASSPASTSASTPRTASSGSRRCSAASSCAPSPSTSTSATSRTSCGTSSTTPTSSAVVYDPQFADRLDAIAGDLPKLRHRIAVGPDFEAMVAAASPERDFGERSPDDLYILYTGGTTGMPKGVMWRQEDVFMALGQGIDAITGHQRRVRRRAGEEGCVEPVPAPDADDAAAHARRRAVGRARPAGAGPDRRTCCRGSRPRRCGASSTTRRSTPS